MLRATADDARRMCVDASARGARRLGIWLKLTSPSCCSPLALPSPAWQHALTCLVEPYRRMWASLGKPQQRVARRLGVRGASDEEVGLGRRRQIGELGALWWQTCGRRVADVAKRVADVTAI